MTLECDTKHSGMAKERLWILTAAFSCTVFAADVRLDQSADGWILRNDRIALELAHTQSGQIVLRSLRNVTSGREWAIAQTETGVSLDAGTGERAGDFRFNSAKIHKLPNEGMELAIESVDSRSQVSSWLTVRCYPGVAALEFKARIENHGTKNTPLIHSDRAAGNLCDHDKRSAHPFR